MTAKGYLDPVSTPVVCKLYKSKSSCRVHQVAQPAFCKSQRFCKMRQVAQPANCANPKQWFFLQGAAGSATCILQIPMVLQDAAGSARLGLVFPPGFFSPTAELWFPVCGEGRVLQAYVIFNLGTHTIAQQGYQELSRKSEENKSLKT